MDTVKKVERMKEVDAAAMFADLVSQILAQGSEMQALLLTVEGNRINLVPVRMDHEEVCGVLDFVAERLGLYDAADNMDKRYMQ